MALNVFPVRGTSPDRQDHIVRLLGTGASAPTKEVGTGITVTRTSAGLYKLTWTDNPGVFLSSLGTLVAATPSDLKNFSIVFDTYDSSTKSLEVQVWNSAGTATDIAATQYIHLLISFKPTGVS